VASLDGPFAKGEGTHVVEWLTAGVLA